MRQVTGRSSKNSETKVSIRLASGGHFFSASTLGNTLSSDTIVEVDTARVTLLPADLAKTISAERALSITGQAPLHNEVAIFSAPKNDIVAAIAINSQCYQTLTSNASTAPTFTTPLLSQNHNAEQCVAIEVSQNICYIRIYNYRLRLAEAIEINSADELVFYVSNILHTTATPATTPIYIIGDKQYAKALKKYYKVICE